MKTSRSTLTVWHSITFLYMAMLMLASFPPKLIPGEPTPFKEILHNSLHVPAYALLAFLIWKSWKRFSLPVVAGLSFSYGLFNEVIQEFVPGRTASLSDAVLNAAGIGLALVTIRIAFEKGAGR